MYVAEQTNVVVEEPEERVVIVNQQRELLFLVALTSYHKIIIVVCLRITRTRDFTFKNSYYYFLFKIWVDLLLRIISQVTQRVCIKT